MIPHLPLGTVHLVLPYAIVPVNIQNTSQCVLVSGAGVGEALLSGSLQSGSADNTSYGQGSWMVRTRSRVMQVWPVWAVENDDGSVACPVHGEYLSMDGACLSLGFHILKQNLIAQQESVLVCKAQRN